MQKFYVFFNSNLQIFFRYNQWVICNDEIYNFLRLSIAFT